MIATSVCRLHFLTDFRATDRSDDFLEVFFGRLPVMFRSYAAVSSHKQADSSIIGIMGLRLKKLCSTSTS